MSTEDQSGLEHMQRALVLARAAVGMASPNPTVGCVLVKQGKIIGEGAHYYNEKDHAEIVALKQAGAEATGATAYVTLEPCSHSGRTGPCADALIAAGIQEVVVATMDPNPLVSGKGIERLRAAGIQVSIGMCETEARKLNDAFAKFIQTQLPFVTLKAALSIEGRLAPPSAVRTERQPHWLTGPAARAHVQRLRHASDAVLTGVGTVLADDPALTDRTGLPRRRPLLRVALDSTLATPLDSRLVKTADDDVLLLCSQNADSNREEALTLRNVQVARMPTVNPGCLDIAAALAHLGQRGILSVLAEAGSRVNGSLIRGRHVDRAILFYAPTELGEDALPFAEGITSPYLFEENLQHLTRRTFGDDACVSGYLRDPWREISR
ncbi:MAG: bifunctional diaminohydroxyphosphoribosylaminopyrimidine deaminase/5-amino-6-(5-phosphoribosylamino)uracil reductase RibD [Acidobacteriaceae bacterium]|nr:bifunctional diaminohydroxyphosphoribosylaminopyrimidine deaminase/5-amino-6-(5-phosphoribosylamino)uracil reductase RibD [Acidobacteriaceae bacterium]